MIRYGVDVQPLAPQEVVEAAFGNPVTLLEGPPGIRDLRLADRYPEALGLLNLQSFVDERAEHLRRQLPAKFVACSQA